MEYVNQKKLFLGKAPLTKRLHAPIDLIRKFTAALQRARIEADAGVSIG